MSTPKEPKVHDFYVGLEPEGRTRHGWAVLEVDAEDVVKITSGTAESAGQAIQEVSALLPLPPKAVGVDGPLFWVTDGDRQVDLSLRRRVLAAGGQAEVVPSVNSQLGVSLVQGVIVAQLASRNWPHSLMTEVNPKALTILSPQTNQFLYQHFSDPAKVKDRDAVLAAYAAWQGAIRQVDWRDLAKLDTQVFMPVTREVSFWFPLV